MPCGSSTPRPALLDSWAMGRERLHARCGPANDLEMEWTFDREPADSHGVERSGHSYQLFERCATGLSTIHAVLLRVRTADVLGQDLYSSGADIAQR